MAALREDGNQQPKPIYHTPSTTNTTTRPAAKILEELVNGSTSSKGSSKFSHSTSKSSFSNFNKSHTENTFTPPSTVPPLPLYPPLPKLPPNAASDRMPNTLVSADVLDHDDIGESLLFGGRYSKYDHPKPEPKSSSTSSASSSSSKRAEAAASLAATFPHHRIIDELKRERDRARDKERGHHRRKGSGDSSNNNNHTNANTNGTHDKPENTTSPTDSHPHRNPQHSRSHSHGRTRSSSSTSDAISSLLIRATARLSQETIRANEAERHAAELLALVKKTHEAKTRLQKDLMRVTEELGLYKIQLDVAQKEIFRAQEIVERVDQQRASAEEDAARARGKMHQLHEELAVERAREEAKNAGFEEGLRQGRELYTASMYANMDMNVRLQRGDSDSIREGRHFTRGGSREKDRRSEVSRYVYPDEDASTVTGPSVASSKGKGKSTRAESLSTHVRSAYPEPPSNAESSSQPQRPRASSSATILNRRPTPPASKNSSAEEPPPDVGLYTALLPRPTITTPVPADVPSTQPQPAPAWPPHQPSAMPHPHPNLNPTSLSSDNDRQSQKQPESIEVQPAPGRHEYERNLDSNEVIRPTSIWHNSPSIMHERVDLPPDNYIPVMDANSMISLPPPHELSRMISPTTETRPTSTIPVDLDTNHETRPRSSSHAASGPYARPTLAPVAPAEGRKRSESRTGYGSTPNYPPPAYKPTEHLNKNNNAAPSRATSNVSRGSTHISQLEILSPPRATAGTARARKYDYEEPESPTLRYSNNRQRYNQNQQQRSMAPTERIAEEWRSANQEYIRPLSPEPTPSVRANTSSKAGATERSGSMMAGTQSSSERPRLHPPRRPREIVLPAPLGDVFTDTKANLVPPPSGGSLSVSTPPHASRTVSNTTVPGIEVETPSTHASTHRFSREAIMNPILLTPESANRPLPPTNNSSQPAGNAEKITMVLPDNNLPAGFVPLSPIIPSLNSYPPGFGPNIRKEHPGTMSPNFTYPSSPLMNAH